MAKRRSRCLPLVVAAVLSQVGRPCGLTPSPATDAVWRKPVAVHGRTARLAEELPKRSALDEAASTKGAKDPKATAGSDQAGC
ncbi:hypothetical protein AK812_SmicGene994 [Symbiodinium microadriaticum]|uniref:Secreted protein n=1 Tax=Symbiodinium microadriaticum TaxID=2951 RepID=A0A1Q9F5C7_SYMMI|nr:hypothetical protein AK812_SmicGene44470 [Symbiodinium microadriaticum]OLQ14809.1 hypothetical protein AK812_SmicGene994 [Symbiodinium microadriaticum]